MNQPHTPLASIVAPVTPCQDLAARYAERYVSVAWQPALRALSSDSSQQLRGAAALPDAQRAAVKTVWTAVNAALDTFTSHPVSCGKLRLDAR